MTIDEDTLLTEREAAKLLRCGARTIIDWRTRGLIPYMRIGRNIRYRRRSLLDHLESLERGGGK